MMDRNDLRNSDLIVPIYLDTNALLDLLASAAGGFSLVDKITTHSATSSSSEMGGRTDFGIPNILNFLKVNFGVSGSRAKANEIGEERRAERYHTYGSLLHQLRGILEKKQLIRCPSSSEEWAAAKPSEFVEIRGRFVSNPLVACMGMLNRLLSIIRLAGGLELSQKGKQQHKQDQAQVRQIDSLQKLFEGLMSDLGSDRVQIFVIEATEPSGHRAVLSLFPDYLRDQSATEIADAELVVLGKVVRNLQLGETINLLRGSALSGLSEEILERLLAEFRNLNQQGTQIPPLVTKVEAPALQIVPISVFV